MVGIPKVAAEDTSIVASNIHGEKKIIPILKGTNIVIDTCGVHYNRTYLVLAKGVWIIVLTKECSPTPKLPLLLLLFFQLVTGMTRLHSSLRVFSKIGLVMLSCLSVLVSKRFLPKICFIYFIFIKIF